MTLRDCSNLHVKWVTYCYGMNQHFLPFWLYSILWEYPNHSILALVEGNLLPPVAKAIEVLKREFTFQDWEVRPNCNLCPMPPSRDRQVANWFIPREYLGNDYACISAAEVLVTRQQPDLVAKHLSVMDEMDVPHSNIPMPKPVSDKPWYNRTYHFFKVAPYFKAVQPVLDRMLAEKPLVDWCRPEAWDMYGYEGVILYDILTEAFGPPKQTAIRHIPTNGLHLRRMYQNEIPEWLVRVGVIQRVHALLVSPLGQQLTKYSVRRSPVFDWNRIAAVLADRIIRYHDREPRPDVGNPDSTQDSVDNA